MDSPVKSFNPNKLLKENFVSNLTGSSMLELFMLLTMIPVLVVMRHSFSFNGRIETDTKRTSLKKSDDEVVSLRNWKIYTVMIAFDFLTLVLPIFLFLIVLAEWTFTRVILLMLVLFFSIISKRYSLEDEIYSVRTYISSYRVLMMLVTCLCILAVDFKVFPRRFAKAETYGTSLMDLGVGSFVFANALVSRQARGISTMSMRNALKSTSPLLFLGFARLVFTSGVDYQVHVGEYGVHWNFFFTLAAVSILTSIFNFSPSYCGVIGLLILAGYQVCLMHGVNAYLLSDKRGTDIISQNKEGIFSIFGIGRFEMEYENWVEVQNRQTLELRSAVQTHFADIELKMLVDTVMNHYYDLFRMKAVAAKSDVLYLMSGMWKTSAERCFMWIGGFRPSDLLKVLVPHLDLLDQQLLEVCNLKQCCQQAEDALSQGMDKILQILADNVAADQLSQGSYNPREGNAMENLVALVCFVNQADHLRLETLHEMSRILTIRQAAQGLLALGEFCHRLRALTSLWATRVKR